MSAKMQDAKEETADPTVVRRVMALKNLQHKSVETYGQFARKVHDLRVEFQDNYRLLNEKRRQIIAGEVEPNEEECKDFDSETMDTLAAKIPQNTVKSGDKRGVPGFWFKTLQSNEDIFDKISASDDHILYHLVDISVTYGQNPAKVTLEFRFTPNEFFTNQVLTKSYDIAFGPNPQSPSEAVNYYPIGRKGCSINWKDGKNMTQEVIKEGKSAKKTIKVDSFFDFFDDSLLKNQPKGGKKANEGEEYCLDNDWIIAQHLIDRLVPNAVLFFAGEANDDDEDTDDDQEMEAFSDAFENESDSSGFDD